MPAEPSSVSSTLLGRARAGQQEAWQRLVDLYGPVVYRWCRGWGLGQEDAADVVQEVFVAVSAHIKGFRRDRPEDTFGGWLRTIAHNKVRDHLRARHGEIAARGGTDAQEQLLRIPEVDPPSADAASPPTDSGFLRRALESVRVEFENRTWEAFWRCTVEGESPASVAERLGMSLQAVYKAKSRVLRKLRQDLGDLLS